MRSNLRPPWIALIIAVTMHAAVVLGQPRESARVALTVDDLPVHAALPPGVTRSDIATQIVRALRARGSPPVYGFVNARALVEQPELIDALTIWRDAGFPLANHGFAHLDLHASSPSAFENDIIANEPTLQRLMPNGGWRWFRYPNLNEGDTAQNHQRILRFLKARDYQVAQVTLNFDDWAYSEPYARCAAIGDQSAIEWLKTSYLRRAAESLPRAQQAARTLFGRDIKYILLLHAGALTALMLPDVLDLLAARGFTLTTLEEASADAAYATTLPFPSRRSGTLFDQLMSARGTPMPPWQEDTFGRLATICKQAGDVQAGSR
jgi:peptidoglycan/xylan/chitin deacetylase (PgdA/CDA1 family)